MLALACQPAFAGDTDGDNIDDSLDNCVYAVNTPQADADGDGLGDVCDSGDQNLVAAGSNWKYLDDGSNQGTAWFANGFDDSSWSNGPAQLGYGQGREATVVSFGPNANSKYPTTYFRHTVNINNPLDWSDLSLGVVRDDGAVVYINGVQVYSDNMPGSFNYLTWASSWVSGANEYTFQTATLSAANLVAGNNHIAVEMHQGAGNSSDLSFDLYLRGSVANSDGDTITDSRDNCPEIANESQADTDTNGIGDACDSDRLSDAHSIRYVPFRSTWLLMVLMAALGGWLVLRRG